MRRWRPVIAPCRVTVATPGETVTGGNDDRRSTHRCCLLAVEAGNVHVAGDVAGGDAPGSGDCDHDVRVVLADAFLGLENVVDGGCDGGSTELIVEPAVKGFDGIGACDDLVLGDEALKCFRPSCQGAFVGGFASLYTRVNS